MELASFAEQILFGTSLDDKMLQPAVLTDRNPGAVRPTPRYPGRPLGLDFGAQDVDEEVLAQRQDFPRAAELVDPAQRARVMHFFANHELLALELMALVLLKFPEAPMAFRRSLAQTMRDEQRHLSLYLQQMERLGVRFGSLPVNDYFWKVLADVATPMQFVARMSLTFEQANLDFALHFRARFAAVGDHEAAAVMDDVFADEVKHVRHGLQWFRRWKDVQLTDWQAFQRELEFPLTPARAKGAVFVRDARRAVGFDNEYIGELETYHASKGRPPRIWLFNPAQEFEIGSPGLSYCQTSMLSELGQDLEPVLLALAARDDLVAMRQPLSLDERLLLLQVGLVVPEQTQLHDRPLRLELDSLRKVSALEPWGVSPQIAKLEQRLPQLLQRRGFPQSHRELVSKSYASGLRKHLLRGMGCDPSDQESLLDDRHASACIVARDVEQALDAARDVAWSRGRSVVFKSSYSSAGHGQLRVGTEGPSAHELSWVRKNIAVYGECVVEPLREIVVEFSSQCEVLVGQDGSRRVRFLGFSRNICSRSGQYLASAVGKMTWGLDPETHQVLYAGGFLARLERWSLAAGEELAAKGYTGPFGVDAYVYRDRHGGLDTNCLGEINLRYTMGRVALALKRRAVPGRTLLFFLLPTEHVVGFESMVTPQFGRRGQMTFAAEESGADKSLRNEGQMLQWQSGWFFMREPRFARRIVPTVWVGEPHAAPSFVAGLAPFLNSSLT
jgi:uncharacterized ferritin-like protein (DUF455 family)